MMTVEEAIVGLHSRLAQKYDYAEQEELFFRIRGMSGEYTQRVIRLCEDDLTPDRMVLIGICYLCAPDIRDVTKAIEWFRRSADLGNPGAMYELGECHEYGTGVAQDRDQALAWYRRSAELGNPTAMFEVAQMSRADDNHEQAFHWFQRSADLGNPEAMERVGTCYLNGTGVAQDEELAITCFQRAIDLCPYATHDAEESLDRLLRNRPDPHAFVRYYCRLYSSCASGAKRDHYLKKLHESSDVVGSWVHLDEQLEALKAQIEALKAENDVLRTEVTYQPGGVGFREAQADFVDKASSPTSPDGAVTRPLNIAEHDGLDP